MTRRAITILALGCALTVSAPALATAASGGTAAQAITDCNDNGRLTQSYSTQALRQALAQMPADVREYTDCFDVIERQLFKEIGQKGSGGAGATGSTSSGSSFLPTWLIVVIVVLALAAITFGALALRRRRTPPGPGAPGGPDAPAGPGPGPAEGPPPGEPGDAEGPPPPSAP
jgi:hypothetical protein